MANCEYCSGDSGGYVSYIPKMGKCNGNAHVYKSLWGSKLIVSLPFGKRCEYQIKYCPMCGKQLNNPRVLMGE